MDVKSLSLLTKKYNIPKFAKWLALFLLYFTISYLTLYITRSVQSWDQVFYADTKRIFLDWTDFESNHGRAEVHPLYVLINFPIVALLKMFTFGDSILAVIVYECAIATFNVFLFYKIVSKLSNKYSWILVPFMSVFYAISFSLFVSVMEIDTFLVGATTLLLFWCYFTYVYNGEITVYKCLILILLGVLSISMTTINYIQFIVGLSCLLVLRKQKDFKSFCLNLLKMIVIVLGSLTLSYLLVLLQQKIFITTRNAFKYFYEYIKWFFTGKGDVGDAYNTSTSISIKNFGHVAIAFFGLTFISGVHKKGKDMGWAYKVDVSVLLVCMMLIMLVALVVAGIVCLKKKKFIVMPYFLGWLSQVCVHLLFGNSESMLYAVQSSFLLLITIFIGLSEIKVKQKYKNKLAIAALTFLVVIFLANLTSCFIFFVRLLKELSFSPDISAFNTLVLVFNAVLIPYTCYQVKKFIEKQEPKPQNLCNRLYGGKSFYLNVSIQILISFSGLIVSVLV